jgi:DNA-damage-inducible protein J
VGTILNTLGLSFTEAVSIYFKQISLNKGIPFAVKIPNQETMVSMENIATKNSSELSRYNSFNDALIDLNIKI